MPISLKKKINGTYFPPGDKPISNRILILTGQAIGESKITNLLEGEDVLNTLKVMKMLGANIKKKDRKYIVFGLPPGALFQPTNPLDFGNSGTGPFSQLIRYPFDTLKIDKSFVDQIFNNNPSKQEMVNVLYRLAKNYSLKVVAEGVETKEQETFLTRLGCNYLQGYYYGTPVTEEDVLALIAKFHNQQETNAR